jgi:hypothetical protein
MIIGGDGEGLQGMHTGAEGEEALHYWNLAASAKRTPRYTRRERHYYTFAYTWHASHY